MNQKLDRFRTYISIYYIYIYIFAHSRFCFAFLFVMFACVWLLILWLTEDLTSLKCPKQGCCLWGNLLLLELRKVFLTILYLLRLCNSIDYRDLVQIIGVRIQMCKFRGNEKKLQKLNNKCFSLACFYVIRYFSFKLLRMLLLRYLWIIQKGASLFLKVEQWNTRWNERICYY